jgi:hypothetical protein
LGKIKDAWLSAKDRFMPPDPSGIDSNPWSKMRQFERDLKTTTMSEERRDADMKRLHSHAMIYYPGRHSQPIPPEVIKGLESLEKEVARQNMVDKARQVMKELGGWPTQKTVEDSLNRSYQKIQTKLRAHDHTYQAAKVLEPARTPDKTANKAKAREHTAEI